MDSLQNSGEKINLTPTMSMTKARNDWSLVSPFFLVAISDAHVSLTWSTPHTSSPSRTVRGSMELWGKQGKKMMTNRIWRKNEYDSEWHPSPNFSLSLLPSLFFSFSCFSPIRKRGGGSRDKGSGFSEKRSGKAQEKGTSYCSPSSFSSLNLMKFISSWSKLQTTHMSSQTESIRWALCIYCLWLSIRATDKNLFLPLIKTSI